MANTDYIESDADIILGRPVIRNTRITVLSERATFSELIAAYPNLAEASLNADLAYASDVISNETVIAVV